MLICYQFQPIGDRYRCQAYFFLGIVVTFIVTVRAQNTVNSCFCKKNTGFIKKLHSFVCWYKLVQMQVWSDKGSSIMQCIWGLSLWYPTYLKNHLFEKIDISDETIDMIKLTKFSIFKDILHFVADPEGENLLKKVEEVETVVVEWVSSRYNIYYML